MIYSIFEKETNNFVKVVFCPEEFIERQYDSKTQYVVVGNHEPPVVIDYEAEMRSTRNQLLLTSDWTQVKDAPVDQDAWAKYRQELRDLPANTEDPRNPVWPTQPV